MLAFDYLFSLHVLEFLYKNKYQLYFS